MNPADLPELPPQSRISSRVDGNDLIIVIPKSARAPLHFGLTAGAAFLAVTFTAQGLLAHSSAWSVAGFFFLLAAALLLAVDFARSLRNPRESTLQITTDGLTLLTGPTDSAARRSWPRSSIASICAEPPTLNLYFSNPQPPICLLKGLDNAELNWIANQIRIRWREQKN
jgi:hypothetical protein